MVWTNPGRSGALLYGLATLIIGGITTVVTRLTIAKRRGRETAAAKLPDGPIIIISNHASYSDGILLALACRRLGRSVRLLATSGVFKAPVIGAMARKVGFIPVERGSSSAADALDSAAEALRAGEAVGIFPEGRTTRDPNMWPERAKTGAVRLAIETNVPIVPIAMVGTHRVLPKKRPALAMIRNVMFRPNVLVDVGTPIDVVAMAGPPPVSQDRVREVTDDVMAQLVKLVADLRGEQPPVPSGPQAENLPSSESQAKS